MSKTIAIEIGHWNNPGERVYKDNDTNTGEEKTWWELKFNLEVGREINNQLIRHGITTLINGPIENVGNMSVEDYFNSWDGVAGSLGGIGAVDFGNHLDNQVKAGILNLDAYIAVHFNAFEDPKTGERTGRGFLTLSNKEGNSHIAASNILCNDIEDAVWARVFTVQDRRSSTFHVSGLSFPTAYCEFGFYDNPEDRINFEHEWQQRLLGRMVAQGILKYLEIEWICDDSNPPVGDLLIYHHFKINLDPAGGFGVPISIRTYANGRPMILPTPIRNGFTFKGWYTEATGGTQVTTNTVFNRNTTIYAHWTTGIITKNISLCIGGTRKVNYRIIPPNATNKNATWRSSDNNVVTVNQEGMIRGERIGRAIITVTTVDGGFSDSCIVTVR